MSEVNETQAASSQTFSHYEDRRQLAENLPSSARLISNSEISTFQDCPRKWWLSWFRGLRQRFESPTGVMATGNRIHRALSMWYVPDGQLRTDPREALETFIKADESYMIQMYTEKNEEVPPGVWIDFNKDANLQRAMIEGYIEWIQETGDDSQFEVVASEQYIEARFPVVNETAPVYLIGKMDVRIRIKTTGDYWFMDHKTVGNFVDKSAFLQMDPQLLHYMLLEYLHVKESGSSTSTESMASSTDISRIQSTTPLGLLLLPETDNICSGCSSMDCSSCGREPNEQRAIEPQSSTLGLPQSSSQQGSDENLLRGTQSEPSQINGESPRNTTHSRNQSENISSTDGTYTERGNSTKDKRDKTSKKFTGSVGAYYNMLRRVKRTATAKPPFYQRIAVHHNKYELESYRLKLTGIIMRMLAVEQRLREGYDHRIVAAPRPTADCRWKCPFVLVCPMFDDGSRPEAMISNYFIEGNPLSYYEAKEGGQ